MAFMNQTIKSELLPGIKAVLRKYGLKGTVSVGNHTALSVTIREGKLDFIGDAISVLRSPQNANIPFLSDSIASLLKEQSLDVNTYHIRSNHSGICQKALLELHQAMNDGNWDKSDPQTDYFNVGWYTYINIGKWRKPYRCTAQMPKVA